MNDQVPAGWYPEPIYGVGQRYWDGIRWTEHVFVSGQQYTSPIDRVTIGPETEAVERPKKIIYWSNLLRIRTWWFAFTSAVVVMFLFSLLGVPAPLWTPVFVAVFLLVGWFWMHQQMSCRSCGTTLRVTRLTGGQEICHRCGAETDRSIQMHLE